LRALRIVGLWAPVGAFIALLQFLSSRSSLPVSGLVWDKLVHAAAYCVLGFLSLRAFHGGIKPLRLTPSLLAMLLTVGYGVLDEMHQSRVPGRDASALDWVADAVGAAVACLAMAVVSGGRAAIRERAARRRLPQRNHPRR
jgi:VanZ family protein